MSAYHIPVLFEESISALVGNRNGVYVDATYGGGGHSAGILSRLGAGGKLIAFDRDSDAISNGASDGRLTLVKSNYRFIHNFIEYFSRSEGVIPEGGVDGILADLGVSSHQFDTAQRGFSFRFDAPLDMRMDKESCLTAAEIVNSYSQERLENVLRTWGEVENSRRIAALICKAREAKTIATTADLGEAIAPALPKFAEHKALAKIYQALRIEVNQEMKSLERFLYGAAKSLKKGGRLVVITYHSIEDRMVKNFIRTGNAIGKEEKDIYGNNGAPLKAVNRKPILPGEEEISSNTRARSAKLRIAEKI